MTIQRIAVLGGGAWGTALALTCARAGREVTLWEYEPGNAASLEQKRESRFLPGVRLDKTIKVTRDLGESASSDAISLWYRHRLFARWSCHLRRQSRTTRR